MEFYPKIWTNQNFFNVTSNISPDAKRRVTRLFLDVVFSHFLYASFNICFAPFFHLTFFFLENQDTRLIHSAQSRKGKRNLGFYSTTFSSTCLSSSLWSTAYIQHHLSAFLLLDLILSKAIYISRLVFLSFSLPYANTYELLIIC